MDEPGDCIGELGGYFYLHVKLPCLVGLRWVDRPGSDAVATEPLGAVRELAVLFEQSARVTSELVVLLGQDRLSGVDQRVNLPGGFLIVLGRARTSNGLGQHFVEGKFDVGVVHQVVLLGHGDRDENPVVDISDVVAFGLVDVLLLANYLFVKALCELFFIKYFFSVAITSHKIPY